VNAIQASYFCIIDCDLTYQAKDILRLVPHMKDYPMVVGERDVRLNPPLYFMAKKFIHWLFKFRFGKAIKDINSGLRIIKTDVFRLYESAICDRFSLTSSLTYSFVLSGLPIRYVPIHYRKGIGKSQVRQLSFLADFIKGLLEVRKRHKTLPIYKP